MNTVKKLIYILPLLALLFSCKNKGEEDVYADWDAKNQQYVDSIANLAKSGTEGWTRHLSYHLAPQYADNNPNDNNVYAYVQILKTGTSTVQPLFNDTVFAHYILQTVPHRTDRNGAVIERTFSGNEINTQTDVSRSLSVNTNLIHGMTTALLHMHVGDSARIVLPSQLSYGSAGNTNGGIRANSTLIYTLKVMSVRRY